MTDSKQLESQIKLSIQNAKQLETENKYEQAIQEYKMLIINTSKLINLQPNNKQKFMNEIAIYALKFVSLEQKNPNIYLSAIKNNLLYQIKNLAENAKKEENFQESYENYLKSSNKLKALIEIDSNPNRIEMYRNKAKEYKTRGIKLRKLYGLKKIEEDDEENDMNDLEKELQVKEDFISDLVQKKSMLNEENESLKSSISVKTSTISNLEDKMANLEKKVNMLEEENIKLKEIEKNEVKKNSEIMELLKNKENECENLKKEKQEQKTNNSNEISDIEYNKLKKDYETSLKNIQELNNIVRNLTEKYKKLKSEKK